MTGLYYYGARYYDPRTSVWQSPDPILNEYMSGQTNGGVFNPRNLSLFTYTYNNPVNLTDPDGESPASVVIKQIAKHGVKEGIKKQGTKLINQRLGKYMNGSMKKQFMKDLDSVASKLDDSWGEIAIELIPVVGDIYGASKGAKKLKEAYDAYQNLENKLVGKIAGSLKGKARTDFIKNMRRNGVSDSKKDYSYMGNSYKKGDQGHHRDSVMGNGNIDKMTDARRIEPMSPGSHLRDGHNGNFQNPSNQGVSDVYK